MVNNSRPMSSGAKGTPGVRSLTGLGVGPPALMKGTPLQLAAREGPVSLSAGAAPKGTVFFPEQLENP